ncbi:hypothetical protein, partial [Klebsiella pneumoniae]|uniref:hypothetical protein n=1 Tax=Klebsiella pneumoniae TaxID=573 RepID=UPI00209BEA4A
KRAYCLKTQPATGETYPKSDLFNKARILLQFRIVCGLTCAVRQTQTGKTERKRAEKEAAAQSFCRLNACKNFETG